MAGSLKTRHTSDDLEESHEINVTPFIDVMLVLLIIFMVAAPLSTVDVAVDLPASNALQQQRPNEPIFLTVKADLSLAFGNDAIPREGVKAALDTKTQGNTDERVFVRADKTVDYGDLMDVMNLLRNAGYLKIGLVGLETTPPRTDPLRVAPSVAPNGPQLSRPQHRRRKQRGARRRRLQLPTPAGLAGTIACHHRQHHPPSPTTSARLNAHLLHGRLAMPLPTTTRRGRVMQRPPSVG